MRHPLHAVAELAFDVLGADVVDAELERGFTVVLDGQAVSVAAPDLAWSQLVSLDQPASSEPWLEPEHDRDDPQQDDGGDDDVSTDHDSPPTAPSSMELTVTSGRKDGL